ncbi:RICIN domain-containing protein [Actinacidiphila soli]|uniref:RICIN domain-containing protein n=1 Tax=Actinacidiphila soli TaxID=2487275 RepID=UPI000FCC8F64|nr:RICIN domain-containing protein [Actinacidiphila soli]
MSLPPGITMYTCNGQSNQFWSHIGNTFQSLGKCLNVTGGGTANSTRVQLWTCNNSGAQQWTAPGDGTLRNPQSGRCLDAAGGGTADGTPVIIYDCNGGSNQLWTYPS